MEYQKIIAHINLATDEDFEFKEVLAFINDAVAKINIECGAIFPFADTEFDLPIDEYPALNETWIRSLIVPYAAGRIKENDSSQFEYTDWYAQFDLNLQKFKSVYNIPEKYIDPDANGGRYEEDYRVNMFSPTKGW